METDEREFFEQALADDAVEAAARRLGFSIEGVPIEDAALRAWGITPEMLDGVGDLEILVAGDDHRILHLTGPGPWKRVRRLIMAVYRAAPSATLLWWWSSPDGWTAAMAEADRQDRTRVKKLTLERDRPDEVGLMQWRSLSPDHLVEDRTPCDAQGWRDHFSEVLDQQGVTRRFFERFSAGLDELVETMDQGPDDQQLRHEIALVTLLRVVFLYFLQARGALDGDRRFVMRRFHDSSRTESFYRAILRPLFFGALNRPTGDRDEAARALGQLPFLNGGLFEPTAAERDYPDLDWDDDTWGRLLEELFERHRFAVEWSDDRDLSRAVDPEMLGKVFEGLMYEGRRRKSGSFYTPRDVVRSMVRDTLASWLADEANLDEEAADLLVDGCADKLSGADRHRARQALADVSVLDPAVGTGAFLLEVLRSLRRIYRTLDEAESVVLTPGQRYDRMRRIVHDHLCGVDIQPTAVRLCELRIWLAMLASLPRLPADEMPPLPNLSHRLCIGNSLLEPLDWIRYRTDDDLSGSVAATPQFNRETTERLATLQRAYTRAHGTEKQQLKQSLDEARKTVQHQLLDHRETRIRRQLEPYALLERSSDLFDESQIDDRQRADKERLEAQLEALDEARDDLEADRRREAAFSFDAHFAPTIADGGFDVIVTNPPWVRTRRIDRSTRDLYRARFDCADHALWDDAADHNIRAAFGTQVDMAALFVERSIELLDDAGRLCALLPVKLLRSLHGSGLRGLVADHHVEYLEDRSEDDEAMFDATTYPAILRLKKQCGPPEPGAAHNTDVTVWRPDGPSSFESRPRHLCVHGDDVREPWILVEPEIRQLFRTMQDHSVSLGRVDELPIRGGCKTGCNDAFLLDPEEAASKFSPQIRDRYLRWAIRGRDVGPGDIDADDRIIWPIDDQGEIAESLPDELEAHFEDFADRLEGRSDYRSGPIWTLFRRHDDIEDHGVVWRDLGEQLEAAVAGPEAIPMNTVYYIPTPSAQAAESLVELFHSEPMRAIASAVAERARGGWRRHFAWVMRLLPLPRRWLAGLADHPESPLRGRDEIRRAWGLSTDDVRRLADWRRGHGDQPRREVA